MRAGIAGFVSLFLSFFQLQAEIIINEFSNGPSGSKEFIELAVIGSLGELKNINTSFTYCYSKNSIPNNKKNLYMIEYLNYLT